MRDLVGSFPDNTVTSLDLDLLNTDLYFVCMWFLTQLGNSDKYHSEELDGLYAILIDFLFNKVV